MKEKRRKVSAVCKIILLVLFTAGTGVAYAYASKLWGEGSVFNKTVSGNAFVQTLFEKVPALIRSAQIITLAILISLIFKLVTVKGIAKSKRGVTIAKLFNSFMKWIIGIVAVLLVLSAWGVDTTALVASAGILSLVIGLGAQSLIADIIAGLFIVIEGEYQVGDIVVIDDWRGTVCEIGIRTTKIEDAGGNIKIVNNSEIKTIINQTQALSVAKATMSIEYGESLPRVELILRDSMEKIKENIPAIIEGPYYKGVTAFSASSVDLLFVAKCNEEDLYQVQRDMNRELKLLFDEHQINIPFPQVVLNQPTVRKDGVGENESSARAFVEEQREKSKHIEEKED